MIAAHAYRKVDNMMTPEEAYEEIERLGREHALIHQSAGGVIVIVHPKLSLRSIACRSEEPIELRGIAGGGGGGGGSGGGYHT